MTRRTAIAAACFAVGLIAGHTLAHLPADPPPRPPAYGDDLLAGLLPPSAAPMSPRTPTADLAASPTPPAPTLPAATPRASRARTATVPAPWALLADCESGATGWDAHGRPIPGSAVWSSREGHYAGGLRFHDGTWTAYRLPGMPAHAELATPAQQIAVARRVQSAQGWAAWPVCSRKVGLP